MFLLLLHVLQTNLNDRGVINLSAHTSGTANNAVSFSGAVTILNNRGSKSMYFSANVSTFQFATFMLGNLF